MPPNTSLHRIPATPLQHRLTLTSPQINNGNEMMLVRGDAPIRSYRQRSWEKKWSAWPFRIIAHGGFPACHEPLPIDSIKLEMIDPTGTVTGRWFMTGCLLLSPNLEEGAYAIEFQMCEGGFI